MTTRAKNVPWGIEPHMRVKHALYRQYLSKWMPIMINGKWAGDITYAEDFAGPGVYLDGSPGSPVIAIESIVRDPALRTRSKNVRFIFVDEDPRCTDLLKRQLIEAVKPVTLDGLKRVGMSVAISTDDYQPRLTHMLADQGAWGKPMLVVLDTFGGGVKYDFVSRIAKNPSSEVLITFQPQYFSRFASADKITHGDEVFGGEQWREVVRHPDDEKTKWIMEAYRRRLQDAGFEFVLTFELVDVRGQSLFLVFGTGHLRGLEKMKEAMWEIDPINGVGYKDPKDPNQQLLDIEIEPNIAPLSRILLSRLQGMREPVRLHELRQYALFDTVYKASQVRPAIERLLERGDVSVDGSIARAASTVRAT
jgi:three-Cys-motif partner protein